MPAVEERKKSRRCSDIRLAPVGLPLGDKPVVFETAGLATVQAKIEVVPVKSNECLTGRLMTTVLRKPIAAKNGHVQIPSASKNGSYRFSRVRSAALACCFRVSNLN